MFWRCAGVNCKDTDVGERAAPRSDRVGKTALFANCLPQPAGSPTSDDGCQQAGGIPFLAFCIRPGGCDNEMGLLELLLLFNENGRRRGGRLVGYRVRLSCSAVCRGIKRAFDQFYEAVMFQVA